MLNIKVKNKFIEKEFNEIVNFFGNLELAIKDMVKREKKYILDQNQLKENEKFVLELMKKQNWPKEKAIEFLSLGSIFEDSDIDTEFEKIRKEMNEWRI